MFKQCEKYFRAHCHVLVVLVLLSILGTAVSIVSPYITGNIITDISSGHSLFPILHKCKVLFLLFLLSVAKSVLLRPKDILLSWNRHYTQAEN